MYEDTPNSIGSYRIIRKIGSGGFGIVYLSQKKGSPEFFALKLIPADKAQKEKSAFDAYKKILAKDGLMPILDSGAEDAFFYYAMPLADSLNADLGIPATDIRYAPKTLASIISDKLERANESWFNPDEILSIIKPIFDAAITIGCNGLLHRDIKPDNIIFLNGRACLSDFGLLQADTKNLSNIGTPYFIAPNWYVNSGGNPDMWGLATSFYMLITGNYPDTMGRVSYALPSNAERTFSDTDKAQWAHWHRCILRATAENPADRFIRLEDFLSAILSPDFSSSLEYEKKQVQHKSSRLKLSIAVSICIVMLAAIFIPSYNAYKKHKAEANLYLKRLEQAQREDEANIAILAKINPVLEQVYREGVVFTNLKLVKMGEEVIIPRLELMSFKEWQADYAKRQKAHIEDLNRLNKLRIENPASPDIKELKFKTDSDRYFFRYDTPVSFDKYRQYIDMQINPEKYVF